MAKQVLLACLSLSLVGCVGLSKNDLNYLPPAKPTISNSEIINSPFKKTWDTLIEKLATQYFVINNVSKDSRIINVSFSTDDASDYIDCGTSTRTFIPGPGAGLPETYIYPTAKSGPQFKVALPNSQNPNFTIPYLGTRKTKLEGRTNIYVAPNSGSSKVSVNTRYIFKSSATFVALTGGHSMTAGAMTISFNTGNTGSHTASDKNGVLKIECVSNGVIERDIINAAK